MKEASASLNHPTTAVAALVAGILWIVWAGYGIGGGFGSSCASPGEVLGDLLLLGAALILATALIGLSGSFRLTGRSIALIGAMGAITLGVGNFLEHCTFDALFLVYVFGALTTVVSSVALGVVLLLQGGFARFAGVAIISGAIALSAAYEVGGAFVFGLAWISLSLLCWQRSATNAQSAPDSPSP